LALVVILIDHIPWNVLDLLTPQNFGFSDAAEAFVFLSGVSVCLGYASTFETAGFARLVRRCAIRAARLYLVQIALAASSIAIALAAAKAAGNESVALMQGLAPFINSPIASAVGVATLDYQPNYSGILPLYVVLMLWAPVVLCLALRNRGLALLVSVAVYMIGRASGGAQTERWPFNPLAWQLIFAIGIVCAVTWREGPPPPQRRLVALAIAIILSGAILSVKAMGVKATALAHLDLSKSELGVFRLVHFLAVAYLIAAAAAAGRWSPRMNRIVRGPTGRRLQAMGRHSLLFFAFGAVASAGGRSLMKVAESAAASHASIHLMGFAYTTAALGAMFALEHRVSRERTASVARSGESAAALTASPIALTTEATRGAAA
jgi:hypothetical protein